MRVRITATFLFASLAAAGQSLAEHAAAAAGSTIGSAAGKSVSNAITKIFGGVDGTVHAATAVPASKATPDPAVAPVTSLVADPGTANRGGTVRRNRRLQTPSGNAATLSPAEPHTSPPPTPEPTLGSLQSLAIGGTETDILAALGVPSSRISIPEEGHLLESYQYRAKGQLLGTVRLDNGRVVGVDPAAGPEQ